MGWLYNAAGASVLIAGLFHATFNSTINPSGFAVAVLDLPHEEVLVVLMGIVVVAGAVVAVVTRARLGLHRRARPSLHLQPSRIESARFLLIAGQRLPDSV